MSATLAVGGGRGVGPAPAPTRRWYRRSAREDGRRNALLLGSERGAMTAAATRIGTMFISIKYTGRITEEQREFLVPGLFKVLFGVKEYVQLGTSS